MRHPSRIVRPGNKGDGNGDVTALEHGEARRVSCFLRSAEDGFPKRLKQGSLTLEGGQAEWSPFWSIKRESLSLAFVPSRVESRAADHREPNVKKGGTAFGAIAVPAFMVVTCVLATGTTVDLVVPSVDEPLVEGFFAKRVK
jgi:hypothetical protein